MNSKKLFGSKYTYMIKLNCYLLIAVGVDNKTFKLSGGDIATKCLKLSIRGFLISIIILPFDKFI